MSDTITTLKTRRSFRAFKPEHVEEEKLQAILEAGTYAPTGMGKQSPIILVIKDQETRQKLAKLNAAAMGMNIDPFYGAPDLVVVLANKDMPTYVYDGSLVMGNMMPVREKILFCMTYLVIKATTGENVGHIS